MILIFKKMNSESLGFSALDQRLNYSIKKKQPQKHTLSKLQVEAGVYLWVHIWGYHEVSLSRIRP